MTVPYSIEWKEKYAYMTFTGIVTGRDILQGVARCVYADERFDNMRYALVNFSEAESFDVAEKEIKSLAYQDMVAAKSNPNTKMAIVAPQDIMKKLAEIYAEYSEPSQWETRVFDTVEDANQWLKSLGLV